MNHEELKKLQNETVRRVSDILSKSEFILGFFLWGSIATGTNDAFSNVDVICFLKDEQKTGREGLFRELGEIYPYLSRLYVYDKYALYLYDNGVRLDVDFLKPSDVKQIERAKAKILYDPTGFIDKHLVDVSNETFPPPDWNDSEGDLAEWFLWMFRQTYNWSRRAEQNTVKSFNKLLMAYNSLSEIRNKLIGIQRYFAKEKEYINHGDPAFRDRIKQTFPSFSSASILAANILLLHEYEQLIPKYYEQLGKSYPENKVEKFKAMLNGYDRAFSWTEKVRSSSTSSSQHNQQFQLC